MSAHPLLVHIAVLLQFAPNLSYFISYNCTHLLNNCGSNYVLYSRKILVVLVQGNSINLNIIFLLNRLSRMTIRGSAGGTSKPYKVSKIKLNQKGITLL
jgi:hypothetical protein